VRRRRDPLREKALDYARQRHNDYGENPKSSRRNIRRNKRAPLRAERHRARQDLAGAEGVLVAGLGEDVEQRWMRRRSKIGSAAFWGKLADAPLDEWVTGRLERRVRLGIDDAATAEERIERIRRTRRTLGRVEPTSRSGHY